MNVLSNKLKLSKLFMLSFCTFSFLLLLNIFDVTKSYGAINKPTYTDLIKSKYDNLSDEEAKSIALEESTLKEAYTDATGALNKVTEMKTTNYGKYPNGYTGAVNYRRKNFLLTAYSLRDLNGKEGFQPLMSGIKSTSNYDQSGFNTKSWNKYGMTSTNTIKWILYQFEIKKLLHVYENADYLILSSIYNNKYEDIIKEKDTLNEVVTLVGNNGLDELEAGDLLLNYDDKNDKVNYVGVYLGKDESKNHYSLSPNKLVYNSKNYAMNVWALSYVNSTNVYAQDIDGIINLVSGTKYNYGLKLKFLR